MRPIDLLDSGQLPPLPSAFLRGESTELLAPLKMLRADERPTGEPPQVDRSTVAAELADANSAYGHPRATELAEKLADPATRVVITGQQPGLVGGPLYTLSKALAAARWAAELEAAGHRAVAIFWMATEDHDFTECAWMAAQVSGGLSRWDLGEDPSPLTPVGMRTLGSGVEEVLTAWHGAVPPDRYGSWIDRVATWYRPDARFGEAFARVLVGMMGERSPLVADAMLPAIKRAQGPLFERLIEARDDLEVALAVADERIAEAGYPLQVRPQRGTSPLFLMRGDERRRIEWKGEDRFVLRGRPDDQDVAVLLETARENPAVISPGVLARPALQDAVFGSYLQILGPGELSYFPQGAPVYQLLGIEAPWVALRPQMVTVTGRQLARMEEHGLEMADLVAGSVDAAKVVMSRSGDDVVSPVLAAVERELEALQAPLLELDRNLERPLEKTVAGIRRNLSALAGKAAAASARRNETLLARVQSLTETVKPGGTLQERTVSGAHFVGRFETFVDSAWEQIGLDPTVLHVVDPEEAR